jgi:chromosome segregation ATPase
MVQKAANDFEEMTKMVEALKDCDKLVARLTSLEQELERKKQESLQKDREVASIIEKKDKELVIIQKGLDNATNFKDQLMAEYDKKYAGWKAQEEDYGKKTSELQKTQSLLKKYTEDNTLLSNELEDAKKELKRNQVEIVELQEHLNEVEPKLRSTEASLRKTEHYVEKFQEQLGYLPVNWENM